ncbi:MAG TPA: hypothetical protein PK653_09935, partial [Syntrophales bacterium]|nr:hypothetical protein [Syntrophales bacterium]
PGDRSPLRREDNASAFRSVSAWSHNPVISWQPGFLNLQVAGSARSIQTLRRDDVISLGNRPLLKRKSRLTTCQMAAQPSLFYLYGMHVFHRPVRMICENFSMENIGKSSFICLISSEKIKIRFNMCLSPVPTIMMMGWMRESCSGRRHRRNGFLAKRFRTCSAAE